MYVVIFPLKKYEANSTEMSRILDKDFKAFYTQLSFYISNMKGVFTLKKALKEFNPKIGIFSPFVYPFSNTAEEVTKDRNIVDTRVYDYMVSDETKIVAKCTPCQCCACR